MLMLRPEFARYVESDVGPETYAAAGQARTNPCRAGGLPQPRNQTGAHVARDPAQRYGVAAPIGARHPERAFHRVLQPRAGALEIGAMVVQVFVMQCPDAGLNRGLRNVTAQP